MNLHNARLVCEEQFCHKNGLFALLNGFIMTFCVNTRILWGCKLCVWWILLYFQVPKDENIIDYISAQFKQENMRETNLIQACDANACFHIPNWLPSLNNLNLHPSISQPNNYSSFEGSSTCSSLSNELKIGCDHHVLKDAISPENSTKNYTDPRLKRKKNSDCGVGVKIRQKTEKGPYKSKNLITERKRRKRIKDGMLVLRALVPKITKVLFGMPHVFSFAI